MCRAAVLRSKRGPNTVTPHVERSLHTVETQTHLVSDPYCIYMYYYHSYMYILLTLSTFNFLSLSFLPQHWTGPELPQSPQQLWPQRRQGHTSFSLCDPDTDPADPCQVVIGGEDSRADPLADVWVLHINTMQWEEVSCGGLCSLSIMSILSLTHALHARSRHVSNGDISSEK